MTLSRYAKPRAVGSVPEGLSEDLTRFLSQVKRMCDDILDGVVAKAQVTEGLLAAGDALGGSGDGAGADTSPPPSPFDVTVGAGTDFIGVVTGNPTFTVGNGYFRTIVYGAKYSGTGPLPTFPAAEVVHEFVGQVGSFPITAGEQWHIWVAWRSRDGGTSSIVGGVNGFTAAYGGPAWISSAMIVNLAVSKLLAGSLAVGEYIQSSGFVPGTTAGYRFDGGGGFEVRTVGGDRVLHLGASGVLPVIKVGSAFQILADGTATFSGTLTASTINGSTINGGTITGSVVQTAAVNKRVTLNESNSNEARFYGDRGDGTIERLATIGVGSGDDFEVLSVGTENLTNTAIFAVSAQAAIVARSTGNVAISGQASGSVPAIIGTSLGTAAAIQGNGGASAPGVRGVTGSSSASPAVVGETGSLSTGPGVRGDAGSGAGHGGIFIGNATRSALFLQPVNAAPTNTTLGGLALIRNPTSLKYNLCWCRNGAWVTVDGQIAWDDPGDTGGGV